MALFLGVQKRSSKNVEREARGRPYPNRRARIKKMLLVNEGKKCLSYEKIAQQTPPPVQDV